MLEYLERLEMNEIISFYSILESLCFVDGQV